MQLRVYCKCAYLSISCIIYLSEILIETKDLSEETNQIKSPPFRQQFSNSLSFIWLLQRRHNIEPWHMQNSHAAGNLIDVPSMHPDGVPISNNDTWANRATIATVSSAAATMLDQPPNYTDALANSEPVKVHMKTQAAPLISLCQRHSSEFKGKVMADDHQVGPARECCICLSTPSKQRTSETGVDALGLTCQQVEGRKRSFCQLDVGRLLSSSPPKYHEISHKFQ